MSYEIEYNAKGLPAVDVARTFVPPELHFGQLWSRNHTLLLGPRGSGKTTLLKMLTVRALNNWHHPLAQDAAKKIQFNAAFIAADRSWREQISSLGLHHGRTDAAFVLHTLRSLVFAMRESVELARNNPPDHLAHLAAPLDTKDEEVLVKSISDPLSLHPPLNSLLGLEIALESKLDAIHSGDSASGFTVDSLSSKISLLISAFNGFTGNDSRRWALLFDELEIAPPQILSLLLTGLRGRDRRVIFKLALAPYLDTAGLEHDPTSSFRIHDFQIIQLSYPNKTAALQFSTNLFISTLNRFSIEYGSLERFFYTPNIANFSRNRRRLERNKVPQVFYHLSRKDDSFRTYAEEAGILSSDFKFGNDRNAQFIRKILPIAISRDHYLGGFESGRVIRDRSRKTYSLYSGFPSVVEITEGNPRAILTLVGPLAQEYQALPPKSKKRGRVPITLENQAIRRVELLLTSLLQVIPLDLTGFRPNNGLLDFVDRVGRAFETRLLKGPFKGDYVGSFFVDADVAPSLVRAVGNALNAGAFVHVPQPDSGPESLLRGLTGQRFRISYSLSARYRLLVTLGDHIHLSELLRNVGTSPLGQTQLSMFREGKAID